MALHELRITKDNRLIEAGYRLNLNEQRLVLAAIGQIDSRKRQRDLITVTAQEFAETYGMEVRHAYSILKEASDELYERDIRYIEGAGKNTRVRWLYKRTYNDKEGSVTLGFSPSIEPYLTMLSQKFTSYQLKNIANFDSVYAIRIYEMAKQYETIGERFVTEEFLRETLELDNKYQRFANIKARVLDPAIKQINQHSDLNLTYAIERKGRSPVGVRFAIKNNPQHPLGL
jgi:plasmid replication initiation protein